VSDAKPPEGWNPALVWPQPGMELPEPSPDDFVVSGTQAVDGHPPGAQFSAHIPDWRKQMLLDGGHLLQLKRHEDERTVEELKAQAKEMGLSGYSKLDKEELSALVDEAAAQGEVSADTAVPADPADTSDADSKE
jgi:hypothetical protein